MLLQHMYQFVRYQPPSHVRLRYEPTRTKHYVVTHCVLMGVYVSCRLLGSRVGMHPHLRKVITEALLHVLLQRRLQWLASPGKRLVYPAWLIVLNSAGYVVMCR